MDTLSAIAEPNRRKIVQLLARSGNLSAGEIARHFKSSAPAISQHLQVLREAKTVFVTRDAQKRIYSLNPQPLLQLGYSLFEIANQWERRLNRLDALLSKEKKGIVRHSRRGNGNKNDSKS